jgi:hypothetical protein
MADDRNWMTTGIICKGAIPNGCIVINATNGCLGLFAIKGQDFFQEPWLGHVAAWD